MVYLLTYCVWGCWIGVDVGCYVDWTEVVVVWGSVRENYFSLSVVAGEGNLGLACLSKDCLEKESRLIGIDVIDDVNGIVEIYETGRGVLASYSTEVKLGLNPPEGGLFNTPVTPPIDGLSFSCLFK